jgi:uncharacterized protein YijF (DUF1287 family)
VEITRAYSLSQTERVLRLNGMNPHQNGHRVRNLALLILLALDGLLLGQANPAAKQDAAAKRAEVARAALAQVGVTIGYDPAYVKLDYPGGDVPMDRGVCTDVVIRALRQVGVDLQVVVHEDKKRSPDAYPNDPLDASIDHRRVPNLMTFFCREKRELPVTSLGADYLPGDIVAWRLPSGQFHVGVVADRLVPGANRPLVVHNIGDGAQCEDVLFAFPLIGHYRWFL